MQACGMNRNATMGKAAQSKQFNGTALSYQARARASVGRRMMTVKAEKVCYNTMCYCNTPRDSSEPYDGIALLEHSASRCPSVAEAVVFPPQF